MMAIGLTTVKRTIAQWKKNDEVLLPHMVLLSINTFSGNSRESKILNTRDRRSLKRLVKGNGRKSVQQPTEMLNQGHKKISTRIMRRELKEMGLRSCGVARKTLVSRANKKKRL